MIDTAKTKIRCKQCVYATKEHAINLIRDGMRMPKNSFQPDKEVTII